MAKLALVTGHVLRDQGNAYALELLHREYNLIECIEAGVESTDGGPLQEKMAAVVEPLVTIWPPPTASTRSPSWPEPGP